VVHDTDNNYAAESDNDNEGGKDNDDDDNNNNLSDVEERDCQLRHYDVVVP